MQSQPPVCQNFRHGAAAPGHQLAVAVDVAVTHVEAAVIARTRDERAELHVPAFVGRPHHLPLLPVMKQSVGVHLAVRRVHLRGEVPIIIVDVAQDYVLNKSHA